MTTPTYVTSAARVQNGNDLAGWFLIRDTRPPVLAPKPTHPMTAREVRA
ncbi:MAG: hypothetical protein JWO85_2637 [Candidatus Eremiobacteraeota bacterium]|nr:hypothetical protein [Candidatus Eremiobacteraeota bacterium]